MLKSTKLKLWRHRFVLKGIARGIVSFLIVCALSSIMSFSLFANEEILNINGENKNEISIEGETDIDNDETTLDKNGPDAMPDEGYGIGDPAVTIEISFLITNRGVQNPDQNPATFVDLGHFILSATAGGLIGDYLSHDVITSLLSLGIEREGYELTGWHIAEFGIELTSLFDSFEIIVPLHNVTFETVWEAVTVAAAVSSAEVTVREHPLEWESPSRFMPFGTAQLFGTLVFGDVTGTEGVYYHSDGAFLSVAIFTLLKQILARL